MITADTKWHDTARLVLEIARQEAVRIGAKYIGTEHLLLALVKETPWSEHRIEKLTYEQVSKVVSDLGLPKGALTPGCQTPAYKHALGAAASEARGQSRPINRRDLWRGLLANSGSCGNNALFFLGIEPQTRAAFA